MDVLSTDCYQVLLSYFNLSEIKGLSVVCKYLRLHTWNCMKHNYVFNHKTLTIEADMYYFKPKFNINYLPEYVVELDFGHLIYDGDYNIRIGSNINKYLPPSLAVCKFNPTFNKKLGYKNYSYLPNNMKEIYLSDDFDQPIGRKTFSYLPEGLLHLELGNGMNAHFNQVIGYKNISYIPSTVKRLTFSDNFNQQINSYLPQNIEYIKFGLSFDKLIDGIIPKTCKELGFCTPFNWQSTLFLKKRHFDAVIKLGIKVSLYYEEEYIAPMGEREHIFDLSNITERKLFIDTVKVY